MTRQNGTAYAQNYDVIVKWMAAVLQGETLDVLGVPSGRIEDVFGFEPLDIAVQAGRVDVMVRDDTNTYYHLEEQRNLRKADLYRFAAYHFHAAKQWGPKVTDIILASGDVSVGTTEIMTNSGRYAPIVIDFTQRDGRQRLAEIRQAIQAGTFESWLELVFLPLYGRETGMTRSELVEEVLHFETELYHADQLSARVLAATLILSNKLIDKQVLRQMWEEIKMLDILDIAREEGLKEGKQEGKTLGLQEGMREMLIEALSDRFDIVSVRISEHIRAIRNLDVLKSLFHQALKCQSLQEFETLLQKIT